MVVGVATVMVVLVSNNGYDGDSGNNGGASNGNGG